MAPLKAEDIRIIFSDEPAAVSLSIHFTSESQNKAWYYSVFHPALILSCLLLNRVLLNRDAVGTILIVFIALLFVDAATPPLIPPTADLEIQVSRY